jgi:hypothetical protein
MVDFQFRREYLLDREGNIHSITGCPLYYLLEFNDLLKLLHEHISVWSNQFPSLSFAQLLEESVTIRSICERISTIHNSQFAIRNLEAETAERLFLGEKPLLLKVNGMLDEKKDSGTGETQSLEEFVATSLSALVSMGLATNLEGAIALAKQYPSDLIWSILTARSYQLDPKSKPVMSKGEEKRMLEELKEEMQSGNFFDGFPFGAAN